MTGAEQANIILEGLALLQEKQPELLASIQANDPFAANAARAWLAATMGEAVTVEEPDAADEAAPSPKRWQAPAVAPGQIPFWPDKARAIPNVFLRSALFGAIRRERRRMIDREQVAALNGIEITYTGPRLDQGDLDAWANIMHLARGKSVGERFRITSFAVLKTMGLTDAGGNRRILETRLGRLNAGTIEDMGRLLDARRDKATHEWVISLNPQIAALFARDQYTLIQWGVRRALAAKPLAQWLYGYYSSHAKPYPMKVETVRRLCGSEAGEKKHFAQSIKKAFEALEQASAENGATFNGRIENKLVYISRTPTAAQQRHLEKQQ